MAKTAKKPARKNPILDKPVDAGVVGDPAAKPSDDTAHDQPAGPQWPLSEQGTWTAARVFYAARQELHQAQHHPWVNVAGEHQAKYVQGFKAKWAEAIADSGADLENWLLLSIVTTVSTWEQRRG